MLRRALIVAPTYASYVTDVFSSWRQTPLSIVVDGGDYLCTITDLPAAAEPPRSDASARRPSQLVGVPFRPSAFFVGRSSELDWLLTTLLDQKRRIAVTASVEGLGGIGKTELILQLLHHPQMTAAFDIFLWLDAAGPLSPQWERTASELGIEVVGTDAAEIVARIGAELRRRYRALIVLDNAHEWASVAHLIPPDIPLVVTTRTRQFGGAAFIHQELTVLPPPAATELLVKSVAWLKDDPDLPRLVERLDGHALALEIAASNIQYWELSAGAYMERLNQYQTDSTGAPSATGARQTVDSCLGLTWNALRHEASRTLWRRAALFAPVPAHRDLLRVSFSGMWHTREELHGMLGSDEEGRLPPYLQHDKGQFPGAYAELRAVHVLGRVEGFTGERWAMHRLVRDFGRARLQKGEVMMHGLAMSEWLQDPTLPLGPEIPHFVSTILDTARFVGEVRTARERRRSTAREVAHLTAGLLGSRGMIEFIRDELHDPRALTIILDGLSDVNDDVRFQSIQLLRTMGPVPEVLKGLVSSLAHPDARTRELAAETLIRYGDASTAEVVGEALRDPRGVVRLVAVSTLVKMGTDAFDTLRLALLHTDPAVQLGSALALACAGVAEAVDVLLAQLPAVPPATYARIIDALGAARDRHP
jgi:hypothetical protein